MEFTKIIKQQHKGITFLSAVEFEDGRAEVAIFRTDISGDEGAIWGRYETAEEAESTFNYLARKSEDNLAEIHAEISIARRYEMEAMEEDEDDDTIYYTPNIDDTVTFQIIDMG